MNQKMNVSMSGDLCMLEEMSYGRFDLETDDKFVIRIKDVISKQYIFNINCESVDDLLFRENLIDEVMNCTVQLNRLWEQYLRVKGQHLSNLNNLSMIDKIVTKTDLDSHKSCMSAIKRIDELIKEYGDLE